MKKTVFYVSVLLVGLTVATFSCSKDDAVHQNEKKPFMTERNLEINRLITSFKGKMSDIRKNPTAKNGETVAADSVVWYLESTINYSHGFPNEYYKEFHTDSLSLIIAKNSDGNVNLTELTQKYDELKSDVAAVYHASTYGDKGLTVVDLYEISETDSETSISVRSTTGEINPNPDTINSNSPPFGPLDDWYYGEDFGHCDNTGTSDASIRLTEKIQPSIPTKNGLNIFYIEQDILMLEGGMPSLLADGGIGTEPTNHLDYYLYYAIDGTSIPFATSMLCIPYQDMNSYYYYLKELIFDVIPNEIIPGGGYSGHTVIACNLTDINVVIPPNGPSKYFHRGIFMLGQKMFASQEPTEIQ